VIPDKTLGPIRNSAGGGHWDWVLQKWESKGHTVLSLSQLCLWLYWCLWLHSWDGWESLLKLGTSNVIWTRSFSHGNYILGSRAKNTSSLMSWIAYTAWWASRLPQVIYEEIQMSNKKRGYDSNDVVSNTNGRRALLFNATRLEVVVWGHQSQSQSWLPTIEHSPTQQSTTSRDTHILTGLRTFK